MHPAEEETSRHKCLIYEGHPSEQLPVLVPLLLEGLRDGRRCLYLGDPEMVGMMDAALARAGLDVRRERDRGALLFSSDRSHLDGGSFDPEAMVGMLRGLIAQALRDGFSGLFATGDMRWELGPDRNFERLREYEARLEKVFRDEPLAGVCQYHMDTVPPQAVQDALLTHRSVFAGAALSRDNLFYIPPELLLDGADGRGGQLADWMWRQIRRIVKAEQQRDRAMAELEKANMALEARVRERTADLEAFSYAVSHDLRTPLRAIQGFGRDVERQAGRLDEEGRESLGRVLAASSRMGDMIEALLQLFKLAEGRLERATVDLSAQARAIVEELRAAEPGRRVEARIEPGLSATGDPRLLGGVLANLLSNAWKFTAKRPEAHIEFGAGGAEGERAFYVKDDGEGYDPAFEGKLFKPFQRLHSAAEFPGNGLGLATARRVLARHGGRLWSESRPGQGAVFYFTLPA